MSPLIALALLSTALLLFVAQLAVGRARGKYGIKAPATTGHPDFERAFRAQMNTVEGAVMFVPVLLVAGAFGNASWAAIFGGAWVLGRVLYLFGYLHSAKARAPGFFIAMAAWALLVVQGVNGLIDALRAS